MATIPGSSQGSTHSSATPNTTQAPHSRGRSPLRFRINHAIALSIALFAFATFTYVSVYQWRNFVSPSWDLGIFTQLVDQYSHFRAPIVDIKGPGFNLLGDHFHPILVLLAPIYRLFPSGLTLLVVQNALFALASYPITRYACARFGNVAGAFIGFAGAFSWGLHTAVVAQFHEIAFAVPLISFGLIAWLEGRYFRAATYLGALVFVKEDMGLTLMAFVAVPPLITLRSSRGSLRERFAVLRSRLSNRSSGWLTPERLGILLGCWGLLWVLLSVFVVLPMFNTAGQWDYYGRFDGNDSGLFAHFSTKMTTVFTLVLTMGAVGTISPFALLILPTLAWRFLGNIPYYWGTDWHYSAILMPIAMVALIDALQYVTSFSQAVTSQTSHHNPQLPATTTGAGLPATTPQTGAPPSKYLRKNTIFATCCALVSLLPSATWATQQGVIPLLRGVNPELSSKQRLSARSSVEAVPQGAKVVTDIYMLAYLVPGRTVFWEGTVQGTPVDYVVFSPHSNHGNGENVLDWARQTFGGDWKIVYDENGYVVVRRLLP
ncbi:DUF2079 domain-containing protein [Actinotignum urinale]|uniref:DUF2079 domain-containing protein n=1 Tax=Actinotignum urinale TaxID=190146 RepID=UPI0003B6D819|nr:DUF2079 domain-containing protein [Actinotignum urinale]MDY5160609.1 DUF2079 domain-containing protein [Actinotignum urinale]